MTSAVSLDAGEEALPLGERTGQERRGEEVAHGVLAAAGRQLAEREQVGRPSAFSTFSQNFSSLPPSVIARPSAHR